MCPDKRDRSMRCLKLPKALLWVSRLVTSFEVKSAGLLVKVERTGLNHEKDSMCVFGSDLPSGW
jgi:hypothetical protein